MKRIITFIVIACALFAAAPVATAQFRWGPSVGFNMNTMKFKQDLFDTHKGFGGSAGVKAEMMFPGIGFGIDMGLLYEQRAAQLDLGDRLIWSSQGYGDEKIRLHSIDIPFNLKFKWTRLGGTEDIIAPLAFGGPVFSFQAGHTGCKALKYSGGEVMLTAGLGVELWRRWQVTAQYTWGMTYALKTQLLTDLSARNRTLDIRVTYFLK